MSTRLNLPPGWPPPPPGWTPPSGWKPDPAWPSPPDGWPLWVDDRTAPPAPGPAVLSDAVDRRRPTTDPLAPPLDVASTSPLAQPLPTPPTPPSPTRQRNVSASQIFGWGGAAGMILIGFASGVGGALVMGGLYAFLVALVALIRGRVRWAHLRTRGVAAVALVPARCRAGPGR